MNIFNFKTAAGIKESMPTITYDKPDYGKVMNETLVKVLDKYGLKVENPHVELNGSEITISGTAQDDATRQKIILALGNIQGISAVRDNMEVLEPAVEPTQFHTVESGESLSKIAKHYYGDAMKYPVIFEANKPMLKDANLIYPGQVLRIPAL